MGPAFLAGVGTVEAAGDMDTVRRLIGDDQINYLGFSYGTEIGTAYVEQFGDHVRAMVLDGAIDPSLDPVERNIRQMAGFQTAFNDYAADCAQLVGLPAGPGSGAVGRPLPPVGRPAGRPTRGDLGPARARLRRCDHRAPCNALYTQQYWKYLTSGLLGLQRGTDAGDLLLLADEYQGRGPDGRYRNLQDAFNAVRCVDAPSPTDAATWVDADQQIREVAPFRPTAPFTGYAPRDICAFWPVPATSVPHSVAPVTPGKVVVVSTTHDPATPYAGGGRPGPPSSAPR